MGLMEKALRTRQLPLLITAQKAFCCIKLVRRHQVNEALLAYDCLLNK